ncbi:MAG: beta-hydroxydecanoyl-ACP dehydratase, partial [Myxococcales bacterium]|nr:beta-hydroxydecanoyl-ACP dehydratase [Myxococcales bacterium]
WLLHEGRMPAGILIESGQADLMLISWMGIDRFNRSERVYRLLGCELTYERGLPEAGATLRYEIHVDGHAVHDGIRLFFFHYDCVDDQGRKVLTVRGGQAGFFTDGELEESAGVLWSPETGEHDATARLDAPAVACTKGSLTGEELQAFSRGDAHACFGPGFEKAASHVATPRIQADRMLLLHRVDVLDPRGGPWGRGYLKATWDVRPDDWFFAGHFKNDPCMPGTLMFEGCLQAMAVYLASLGYTIRRDGWRFEPVHEEPFVLSCRGQVTPKSRALTYEVFVEEVVAGPIPTIHADLLCTVDGLKAFHARRVGLRLIPAWPLDEGHPLLERAGGPADYAGPLARAGAFAFDYASLLACAQGRPTTAFGPVYARFDGPEGVARLPNPP